MKIFLYVVRDYVVNEELTPLNLKWNVRKHGA